MDLVLSRAFGTLTCHSVVPPPRVTLGPPQRLEHLLRYSPSGSLDCGARESFGEQAEKGVHA